jgi:hypothetical protein
LSWLAWAIKKSLHPVVYTPIFSFERCSQRPLRKLKAKLVFIFVSRSHDHHLILPCWVVVQEKSVFIAQVVQGLFALLGSLHPQDFGHSTSQDPDSFDSSDFTHLHYHPASHLLPTAVHLFGVVKDHLKRLDLLEHHHVWARLT